MSQKSSKIQYDPESDALSILLKEGEEEEFKEISPGISIEINSRGEVIGFEILNASRRLQSVAEPLYRKAQAYSG